MTITIVSDNQYFALGLSGSLNVDSSCVMNVDEFVSNSRRFTNGVILICIYNMNKLRDLCLCVGQLDCTPVFFLPSNIYSACSGLGKRFLSTKITQCDLYEALFSVININEEPITFDNLSVSEEKIYSHIVMIAKSVRCYIDVMHRSNGLAKSYYYRRVLFFLGFKQVNQYNLFISEYISLIVLSVSYKTSGV